MGPRTLLGGILSWDQSKKFSFSPEMRREPEVWHTSLSRDGHDLDRIDPLVSTHTFLEASSAPGPLLGSETLR